MNAQPRDEYSAPANSVPYMPTSRPMPDTTCTDNSGPLLIADLAAGRVTLGADGRRKSKRLTIDEQDKLRARIATLESRLRYTGAAMVAVALACLVIGRIFA